MSRTYIVRDKGRKFLFMPQDATKKNPSTIIPLYKTDRGELDELVRAQLEKRGVSGESALNDAIEKSENYREGRQKKIEASREIHRLMAIRAEGHSLMQLGFRKWKEAFYMGGKGR